MYSKCFCASPSAIAPSPLSLSPRATFLSPRGVSRGGPSALARLGITSRDGVPNEVKDASLSLGRTKNGGSAGQSRGTFLNNPTRGLTKDKKAVFLYKKFTI